MSNGLLFRVDAARHPGLSFGHASRCLAVCEAIRGIAPQVPIKFMMRYNDDGNAYVRKAGFEVETICWDLAPDEELAHILSAPEKVVIFDLLNVERFAPMAMAEKRKKIIVIDDGDSRPIDTDIIINGSPNAAETPYIMSKGGARQLLGPSYSIIAKQICDAAASTPPINEKASKCLITFGGSDPMDLTNQVVSALAGKIGEMELNVVLGPGYGPKSRICSGFDIKIHQNIPEFGALLSQMDIVVAAGGRTAYELATLGLPAVLIPSFPHEIGPIKALAAAGTAVCVDEVGPQLVEKILALAEDSARRSRMRKAGRNLFDGKGATRVAKEVLALQSSEAL